MTLPRSKVSCDCSPRAMRHDTIHTWLRHPSYGVWTKIVQLPRRHRGGWRIAPPTSSPRYEVAYRLLGHKASNLLRFCASRPCSLTVRSQAKNPLLAPGYRQIPVRDPSDNPVTFSSRIARVGGWLAVAGRVGARQSQSESQMRLQGRPLPHIATSSPICGICKNSRHWWIAWGIIRLKLC